MVEETSYQQLKKDADGCFQNGCLLVMGLVIVVFGLFMFAMVLS
jgi:hypothetical protein